MTLPAQTSETADCTRFPHYSCPKCKSKNVSLALLPYVPEHTICGFLGYLIDGDTVDVWMSVNAACQDCNYEDEPFRFPAHAAWTSDNQMPDATPPVAHLHLPLVRYTECKADEPTGLRFRWEPRE
jgi:hypothetical protein